MFNLCSTCSTSVTSYVQNFRALFVFVFVFFLSHSVAVAAWCGTRRVDPQMIHFELFYHLVHRSQLNPKQYLFTFGSWKKKIYILGIHLRKIITPVPFYSKAFVLPQKFDTSWALRGRLSGGFFFSFAISEASNFKHSFAFHEPVLDFGMLMWELPGRVSYFVSSLL